ncbi:hypothetical protein [Erwinia tasmaniensis]|uniref:hypothetical protein n=1 Tax=Erwinia tasmaniensis TaxID=338565 RepID=UPI003A4E18D3
MQRSEISAMHKKIAGMRFIAELSLIANCKPSDLELALTLIADLANTGPQIEAEDEIFYAAE